MTEPSIPPSIPKATFALCPNPTGKYPRSFILLFGRMYITAATTVRVLFTVAEMHNQGESRVITTDVQRCANSKPSASCLWNQRSCSYCWQSDVFDE